MNDHKAHRIRRHPDYPTWFRLNSESKEGHPYLAIPWPEDCPWSFENFPLPGTEVTAKSFGVANTVKIIGPPRYSRVEGRWMVPCEFDNGEFYFEPCEYIPAICNARRRCTQCGGVLNEAPTPKGSGCRCEANEVVGTLKVVKCAGETTLSYCLDEVDPGTYDIVKP